MYKAIVMDDGWYIENENGKKVFPKEVSVCSWEFSEDTLSEDAAAKFGNMMADILNWDNGRAKTLFDVNNLAFPEVEGDLRFYTKDDNEAVALTSQQAQYLKELLQQFPFIDKKSIEFVGGDVMLWDVNVSKARFPYDIDEDEVEMFLHYFVAQVIEALGFKYDLY